MICQSGNKMNAREWERKEATKEHERTNESDKTRSNVERERVRILFLLVKIDYILTIVRRRFFHYDMRNSKTLVAFYSTAKPFTL